MQMRGSNQSSFVGSVVLGLNFLNSSFGQALVLANTMAMFSLRADANRYFLGYLWWILEPLLWITIFYLVFEVFLGSGRDDFLIFLSVGKLTFIWFSKSVNQAANSLIAARGLIGNMDAKKWLFPMAACQEGLLKQVVVFVMLLVILSVNGYPPSWGWIWVLPLALTQHILILGCGMLGALLVCVQRDFQFLIQLGIMFLMFMSGIFWDIGSVSESSIRDTLLFANPVASVIDLYRGLLLEGQSPVGFQWGLMTAQSLIVLGLVSLIFRRLHYWLAERVLSH